MDIYTIGRQVFLPGVIGILTAATILMLVTLPFTFVRVLSSIQRLLQTREVSGRTIVTINIFPGKGPSKPPMQAEDN
jgi:hypothetical protein